MVRADVHPVCTVNDIYIQVTSPTVFLALQQVEVRIAQYMLEVVSL